MVNPYTQKPSFPFNTLFQFQSKPTAMSLFLHCHAPHHSMATLSPFSTFNSKPLCASLPNPSFLTHQQQQQHPYPLTTTTTSDHKPLSVSTLPRKLLCKPPKGKYVREDYLVVCHFKLLQFFLSLCFWVLFSNL